MALSVTCCVSKRKAAVQRMEEEDMLSSILYISHSHSH